jgi:stress responsive alpha/beta barrel protein
MFRSFFQTACLACGFALVAGIVAATFTSGQLAAAVQDESAAAPLRHVVLFKFKPEATKEQIQEIVAGFQALPKKIDGIAAFEWGTDNSSEGLAEGFTHCFVVTFKDAKARDAYLPHQAHKDFVAILLPKLDKVLVVDYFARK